MEQALGMNLDDYTYAEAAQMFCEHGREKWQHTASIIAYITAANADPKKAKNIRPDDFNPWENTSKRKGIKLTRQNLHLMQRMATNVQGSR